MLQTDKSNKGFTLIELLVAAAMVGFISIVAVNLLFGTVISRARQDSLQSASEDVRNFVSQLSGSIKQANTINVVSASEIRTSEEKNNPDGSKTYVCKTFRQTGIAIELAEISGSSSCIPPTSGFKVITDPDTTISLFSITNSGSSVVLNLSASHKDSFGVLELRNYSTTIVPRI